MQHVPLGADLVAGHHRPVRVAQQSRMDPGEVTEVREVLYLAGGITGPAVRAGRHHLPPPGLQLGHAGKWPARLFQGHPHQAVPFLAAERADPGLGRHLPRVLQLRDGHAAPVGPVTPAVVRADEFIAADPPERQRRAAVHAQIRVGPGLAVCPAPHHQGLAQQVSVDWPVREVAAERDRMPARPQRPPVGKRRRPAHRVTSRTSPSLGRPARPAAGGACSARRSWTKRAASMVPTPVTRLYPGPAW